MHTSLYRLIHISITITPPSVANAATQLCCAMTMTLHLKTALRRVTPSAQLTWCFSSLSPSLPCASVEHPLYHIRICVCGRVMCGWLSEL